MSRLDITDVNQKVPLKDLQPTQDHLLVEVLARLRSERGLVLPKGENDYVKMARVVAVGSGETNQETGEAYPIPFKPGDVVLLMDYAGQRIELRDGKYRLIRQHGIWAKVTLDKGNQVAAIEPAGDVVVLEFPETERTISGRMILPSMMQTHFRTAKVVKAGPGKRNLATGIVIPCSVSGGERVVTRRYSGADVKVAGKLLRLQNDGDLQAVIEGEGDVDICIPPPELAVEDKTLREERESKAQLEEFQKRGILTPDFPVEGMPV